MPFFRKRLDDGEAGSLTIADKENAKVAKAAKYEKKVKLQPVAEDKTGKKYYGKKWKIDVRKFT